MAVYEYTALDSRGREVRGVIDAGSEREARTRLRRDGVYPTSVGEMAGRTRVSRPEAGEARVRRSELAPFTRQLATLLSAGVPLEGALGALIEQVGERPLKRVLMSVREDVREGLPLSDAMERHGRLFSSIYVNMVRAAESSGSLERILERLADHEDKDVRYRQRIRGILIYPAVVTVVAVLVTAVLMIFVIPMLTDVFYTLGGDLPALTRGLVATGLFFKRWGWAVAIGLAAAVVALNRYGKTEKGRFAFDRMKLRIPVVGPLVRKVVVGRFARTLETLISSGVPILAAMDIVKMVVGNALFERAIGDAGKQIGEGTSIAGPLARAGVFPPVLIQMIAVGEQSGNLETMLARAADGFEHEAEAGLNTVVSVLEPALIVMVGLVVAVVVLAIMLPIFGTAGLMG